MAIEQGPRGDKPKEKPERETLNTTLRGLGAREKNAAEAVLGPAQKIGASDRPELHAAIGEYHTTSKAIGRAERDQAWVQTLDSMGVPPNTINNAVDRIVGTEIAHQASETRTDDHTEIPHDAPSDFVQKYRARNNQGGREAFETVQQAISAARNEGASNQTISELMKGAEAYGRVSETELFTSAMEQTIPPADQVQVLQLRDAQDPARVDRDATPERTEEVVDPLEDIVNPPQTINEAYETRVAGHIAEGSAIERSLKATEPAIVELLVQFPEEARKIVTDYIDAVVLRVRHERDTKWVNGLSQRAPREDVITAWDAMQHGDEK